MFTSAGVELRAIREDRDPAGLKRGTVAIGGGGGRRAWVEQPGMGNREDR